jgi:pimeloyl-ACP methyl ester carboxylesterase
MNRLRMLSVVFALTLAAQHLLSQANPYPFTVQESGHGEKSIIFIPGLGCSGDVWKETRTLSLSFSAW